MLGHEPRYSFFTEDDDTTGDQLCRAECNRCGSAGKGDGVRTALDALKHASHCPIALETAANNAADGDVPL